MNYQDKKLKLQLTSESAYLQACVVPTEHHARVLSTAADAKFACRVVRIVANLFQLRSILLKVSISDLDARAEKKSSQGIGRKISMRKELNCSIADKRCSMDLWILWKSRQRF